LCKLNTSIIVDAKRYGIPFYQLLELDMEYHRINGDQHPQNLLDLLEVVC